MAHQHPGLFRADDLPDLVLNAVFSIIHEAPDRCALSLVCRRWYEMEARTRKDVTIAFCYATDPARLSRRFGFLESVKVKGMPRPSKFKPFWLLPAHWRGFAAPWISEISLNCRHLKSVHLRRMIVIDDDLFTLARERGHMLHVLKLDRCFGFSTVGIAAITRACRCLQVLVLDDSIIDDQGGDWLHELALHNTSLEVLNFSGIDLEDVNITDLQTVAKNCKFLKSLKLPRVDIVHLTELLKTSNLQELGGISVGHDGVTSPGVKLPCSITSLVDLVYMGIGDGDLTVNPLVRPIAEGLKKIGLQSALLSIAGHCELLKCCPNLEDLEVLGIGDEGLEVIASSCKNIRRLRVEHGRIWMPEAFITQKGLTSVALNCHQLESINVYISNINNAALTTIAENCPKLKDFRLVRIGEKNDFTEYPLDAGVMELVQRCRIRRLTLYFRRGFITDRCMGQLGKYAKSLKRVLFGLLGETDTGLDLFAENCPSLEKLEMSDCAFTERGIASSILKMKSLKFMWAQGYHASGTLGDLLLPMNCAAWKVEVISAANPLGEDAPQFLAHRWLAKKAWGCA